jgi:hypothetical protein
MFDLGLNPPILWGFVALSLSCLSTALNPYSAIAQYAYSSPSLNTFALPVSTQPTFSIQADGVSCNAGGGSAPSLFFGVVGGKDSRITPNNDSTVNDGSSNFGSAVAGFNIPLTSPSTRNVNCQTILGLIEGKNYLAILKSLKDMGAIDDKTLQLKLDEFMTAASKRLNISFGPLN